MFCNDLKSLDMSLDVVLTLLLSLPVSSLESH